MNFEDFDDEDERRENALKQRPVKRMVISVERVANGFIVEIKGSVYVFKSLPEAFEFLDGELNKNYEALNVR